MEVPKHVSIIMDGNGRWAKLQGRERGYGHAHGVESVRAAIRAASDAGVQYLSLYAFSEENWSRPQDEVNTLMELLSKAISEELETLIANNGRLIVLGNLSRLPAMVREGLEDAMRATRECNKLTLVVFLSYSGRWDILQAAKAIAKESLAKSDPESFIGSLTQDDFSSYLSTSGIPDPDIIIRTSGEQRISNYLLWQGAYTEFVFMNVLWPDFREEHFAAALKEYAGRERRYGNVK